MKIFQKVLMIACLLPFVLFAGEQNTRAITPEDIVNICEVSDPQISPDGKRVIFVVTEPGDTSKPELPRNSDIWIVPADGSKPPRKYAFGPKQEAMPLWSPDGNYLAFLSDRKEDKTNQIFLMYTIGGEAEAITEVKAGVNTFKWHADSRTIAFTAPDSLTAEEEEKNKAKDDERVLDENFKYLRLYEVDGISRKVTLISGENESINDFAFSPDGKQVCLSVSPTPKLDDVYHQSKLVLINRDGSERKVISEKCFGNVRWSRDGKQILYFAPVGKGITALPGVIASNSSEPTLFAENYRGTIWEMDWFPDSQSLLVSSQEGTQGIIGNLDTKSGKVKRLHAVGLPFRGANNSSVSVDGEWIAFIDASATSPPDVWIMHANGSSVKRLTRINPQVDSLALGSVETVQWRSKDGTPIEGVLVKPAGDDKDKRYPLVVQVHGGPNWSWWNGWLASWHDWAQLLASHGYAVLLPNPRGSLGYGWKFVEANLNDWGGGDFADIMSGVDHLIKEGIADPERLVIGGWSYGGFMTSWAVSQTGRFKAAIMGAGLANLTSMYGTTDIPRRMRLYFEGNPFDRKQVYEQHSALSFIKNVKTPTLILHGESDVRVPISQSYEFYQGLRDIKIETKFVIYPREPHLISARAHQLDMLQRVLDWYNAHLKAR